ncbi:MAG: hypothetical protein HY650_01560 [Acidobacteria bacterium]|nr:hypothetical protein [Acidobacteriota bacterium]
MPKSRKAAAVALDDLQDRIFRFAIETEVPDDSFLLVPIDFDEADQVRYCIDGLSLALVSHCYHRHPRGENVYEVMEELERTKVRSPVRKRIKKRADEAAAKQIPYIIAINDLVESYYALRSRLEILLPQPGKKATKRR